MHAVPRRVENNQIRLFLNLINYAQNISGNECTIGNSVFLRVLTCRRHRLFNDLNTDHFRSRRRNELRNRARPAVKIKDNRLFIHPVFRAFRRDPSDIVSRDTVQHFGAIAVRLEERKRRYKKPQTEDLLFKRCLPIQDLCSLVLDNIRYRIIFRVQDACEPALQGQRHQRIPHSFEQFLFGSRIPVC